MNESYADDAAADASPAPQAIAPWPGALPEGKGRGLLGLDALPPELAARLLAGSAAGPPADARRVDGDAGVAAPAMDGWPAYADGTQAPLHGVDPGFPALARANEPPFGPDWASELMAGGGYSRIPAQGSDTERFFVDPSIVIRDESGDRWPELPDLPGGEDDGGWLLPAMPGDEYLHELAAPPAGADAAPAAGAPTAAAEDAARARAAEQERARASTQQFLQALDSAGEFRRDRAGLAHRFDFGAWRQNQQDQYARMFGALPDWAQQGFLRLVGFGPEREALARGMMPSGGAFHGFGGAGPLKFDMYLMPVRLGPGQTPEGFALNFARNPNFMGGPFTDYAHFYPWRGNHGALTGMPAVGDIFDIGIYEAGTFPGESRALGDNGSIMVTEFSPQGNNTRWRFSTLNTSGLARRYKNQSDLTKGEHFFGTTGAHAVTGNREWGFFESNGQLYLYSLGASRYESAITAPLEWAYKYYDPISSGEWPAHAAVNRVGGYQPLTWVSMLKSARDRIVHDGGSTGMPEYTEFTAATSPVLKAVPDNLHFH